MKTRFANSNIVEIVDLRVNNGTLEIDFTKDMTAEEIEALLKNKEAMTKIELLGENDEPICYYTNFTNFAGVYSKDDLKRGYAVQPQAEIEVRLNEVQQTATEAMTIAKNSAEGVSVTGRLETVGLFYAQTLEDDSALEVKDIYETWQELVDKQFTARKQDYKFTHNNTLYKTAKDNVSFQSQLVPGEGTESLYTVINKKNAGTKEDPIPYSGNMSLEKGKFYIQDAVVYECIRDSEIALHNLLKDVIGNYVKISQ